MPEEPPQYSRETRFCPFCFQQAFDMGDVSGERVYCEICGVDVEVKELVK